MFRHFSVLKVLRMTPNRLLKEFFHQLGHQLLSLDCASSKSVNPSPS